MAKQFHSAEKMAGSAQNRKILKGPLAQIRN